jgi:hypothetical protein
MPVGIAQLLNNTNFKLHYHNTESKLEFDVPVKTTQYENNGWIPSSDTTDDTLPWYNDDDPEDHIIRIKVGDNQDLKFSEKDAKFRVSYPTSNGYETISMGGLDNGARYVIRLDESLRLDSGSILSVSIYKYDDTLKASSGYIAASLLLSAGTVVAAALMAIFF